MEHEEKTFTQALENLRTAASEIGRQQTTLEDAMKLLERGMKEAAYCHSILEEAEQKIEFYEQEDRDETV